ARRRLVDSEGVHGREYRRSGRRCNDACSAGGRMEAHVPEGDFQLGRLPEGLHQILEPSLAPTPRHQIVDVGGLLSRNLAELVAGIHLDPGEIWIAVPL